MKDGLGGSRDLGAGVWEEPYQFGSRSFFDGVVMGVGLRGFNGLGLPTG